MINAADDLTANVASLGFDLGPAIVSMPLSLVFTPDAFQAAAAFNSQKDIAGCVSWAPDIYNLEKVKGNRILVAGTINGFGLVRMTWSGVAGPCCDRRATSG